MGSDSARVEVGLLGRLEVRVEGRPVDVPPGQQRRLLAALALRAGRAVAVSALVDYLWGEDLPVEPRAGVQNNVQRLRRRLGAAAIGTVGDGYLLDIEPDRVDALRFLRLAEQIAAEPGRRDLIDEALALWRGDALVDLGSAVLEREWVPALTERRLAVVEARVDDDIEHGRYESAIADLRESTARYPLRESLWTRLLTALHRSGRAAEALEAYEQVRVRLADELGTDPSPPLQKLYHRLLTASAPAASDGGRGVPRELPAAPRLFTGRSVELSRLVELLGRTGQAPPVVAVHGPGGVGKSALAVMAAHQMGTAFPDGQLYLDLAGATPGRDPVAPQAALARMLFSLGAVEVPPDLDAAAARFRSELDGKRLLILLDNAYDEAQVRPLLPGSAGCGALITSRKVLPGLHQTTHLQLHALAEERAHRLLTDLIGADRAEAEPEALHKIAGLCGRLPLSLRIAAARIISRPTWTLESFAGRLADSAQRLHQLRSGDLDLAATFDVSYVHLEEEQARAFRLCAVPQGPDLEIDAAAALLDRPVAVTEELLEALVDHALLETHAPGRYRYHNLIHLYAQHKAATEDTPDEHDHAAERLVAYYTATARNASETISPGFRWPESLLPPEQPGHRHETTEAAVAWQFAHGPHLLAAIEDAVDRSGMLAAATDLLCTSYRLYSAGGYDRHRIERLARCLAETACARGDDRSRALATFQIGMLRHFSHDLVGALLDFETVAGLAHTIGDRRLMADSRYLQALVLRAQRRYAEAVVAAKSATEISRQLGQAAEEAQALDTLARIYLDQGDIDQALATADRSDRIAERLGDPEVMGSAAYARGVILREAGRFDEAGDALVSALEHFKRIGVTTGVIFLLYHLAETHRLAGDLDTATNYARQSLGSSLDLGSDFDIGRARTILGKIHTAQGEYQQARTELQAAYEIFRRLELPEVDDVRTLLDDLVGNEHGSTPVGHPSDDARPEASL